MSDLPVCNIPTTEWNNVSNCIMKVLQTDPLCNPNTLPSPQCQTNLNTKCATASKDLSPDKFVSWNVCVAKGGDPQDCCKKI